MSNRTVCTLSAYNKSFYYAARAGSASRFLPTRQQFDPTINVSLYVFPARNSDQLPGEIVCYQEKLLILQTVFAYARVCLDTCLQIRFIGLFCSCY